MTPRTSIAALQQPFAVWAHLATKTGETLVASAQVIGLRTGRIAAAGLLPSPRDQREFTLMGQEKLDAAAESAAAMGRQWLALTADGGVAAWRHWVDAGAAAVSLLSSRTAEQSVARHAALTRTLARSAASAGRLGHAGAHIARRGLKPIHAKATANARRLANG